MDETANETLIKGFIAIKIKIAVKMYCVIEVGGTTRTINYECVFRKLVELKIGQFLLFYSSALKLLFN